MKRAEAASDVVARDLPGDGEDGRGAGVSGGQAAGGVVHPGTGDYEDDSGLARDAGIAVGHVGGGLLVAGGDHADAGLVPQGGDDARHVDAGNAEDDLHAFPDKGFHQGLAAAHGGHGAFGPLVTVMMASEGAPGSLRLGPGNDVPHLHEVGLRNVDSRRSGGPAVKRSPRIVAEGRRSGCRRPLGCGVPAGRRGSDSRKNKRSNLVPPVGLEPTTFGLRVRCSAN